MSISAAAVSKVRDTNPKTDNAKLFGELKLHGEEI
jgi:hypothetical protein